jgi:hypothetical protein
MVGRGLLKMTTQEANWEAMSCDVDIHKFDTIKCQVASLDEQFIEHIWVRLV